MKKVIHYIKSIHFVYYLLFVISFLIFFWNNSDSIPKLPSINPGAKLFIDTISLSYMASLIFYIMVSHIPRQRELRRIHPYIQKNTNTLIADYKNLLKSMAAISKSGLDIDKLQGDDLQKILGNINPFSAGIHSVIGRNGKEKKRNWWESMISQKNTSHECIEKLLPYIGFMESELVSKLMRIENCNYLKILEETAKLATVVRKSGQFDDLLYMHNWMLDYYLMIIDLEEYLVKEYHFPLATIENMKMNTGCEMLPD